jgi:hypothetical protein
MGETKMASMAARNLDMDLKESVGNVKIVKSFIKKIGTHIIRVKSDGSMSCNIINAVC